MNNQRRKQIKNIEKNIDIAYNNPSDEFFINGIISDIEDVLMEEESCYDNLPESLQYSERAYKMEVAIDNLQEAIDTLENIDFDVDDFDDDWDDEDEDEDEIFSFNSNDDALFELESEIKTSLIEAKMYLIDARTA